MFLRTFALALVASVVTLAKDQYIGSATFYETGLGACGGHNSDSDYIVAVDHQTFDTFPGAGSNPNNNPICYKQIAITYQGKTVNAAIVDRCPGCNPGDLDLSPAVFNRLADPSVGRLNGVEWHYI